jgi:FAD synthase
VEFHKYLREEKKFSSVKELCRQIEKDLRESVAYFEEK